MEDVQAEVAELREQIEVIKMTILTRDEGRACGLIELGKWGKLAEWAREREESALAAQRESVCVGS